MNQLAIELNNHAVRALQSGRLHEALETISLGCRLISEQNHEHTDMDPTQYRFHWTDCHHEAYKNHSDKANSPSEPFLYLYFLLISSPDNSEHVKRQEDNHCPCGFAWAIWYKYGRQDL